MLLHLGGLFVVGAEDTLFALSLDGPTRGRMATLATVALIAVVALGVARARLPMSGPTWRILHGFLAVLVIGLGFGHAILTDGALDGFGTAVLLAFAAVALLGVVAAYAARTRRARKIALAAAPAALRGSRHERGERDGTEQRGPPAPRGRHRRRDRAEPRASTATRTRRRPISSSRSASRTPSR